MNQDEFIESLKKDISEKKFLDNREAELPSIEDDQLGTHSSSRIAASRFGCSSVPLLTLTQSSERGCHAALVHQIHQWTSIWLCGNPITIDIHSGFVK